MCDNGEAGWGMQCDESTQGDGLAETTTPPKEREESESLDTALEVLADRRRRTVVAYFLEADVRTATVSELAERYRRDVDGSRNPLSVDRAALHLHHHHLPKLEDAGVVEYDTRSETVRYRGDRLVESLLGHARLRDSEIADNSV